MDDKNSLPELFGAVEIVKERPLDPVDIWVIVAYFGPDKRWSVRPSFWFARETAEQEAMSLGASWTHRRIVRIEVP